MRKGSQPVEKETSTHWYHTIIFKTMIIFIITLIPIVMLFVHLFYDFRKETIERLSEATLATDKEIFENFYSKIEEVELHMYELNTSSKLTSLSDLWDYYDKAERGEKIAEIQRLLQGYTYIGWDITTLRIYLPQRDVCIHYSYWGDMNQEDYDIIDQYYEQSENWLINEEGVQLYFSDSMRKDDNRSISRMTITNYQLKELLDLFAKDEISSSIILVNGEVLNKTVQNETLVNAVLDYYEKHKEMQVEEEFEVQVGREKYFCSYVGDGGKRIEVLTCRAYDKILEKSNQNMWRLYGMTGVCIFMFCIYLAYMNRNIRRPVVVLNEAFRQMRGEDEAVLIKNISKDEFNNLYTGFNEMSLRLTKNIQENYLMTINLQRAQLKELQAQINPHFLYNTLFIIKSRIQTGNLEGAKKMTTMLSDYFRFMNRNRKDVIQLREELECVCTYMNIQAERFSNKLHFLMDVVPTEIQALPLPRLLLQPIVENACKYMIEQIEENGMIHVYFEQRGSKVCIIVESEGIEITQEKVDGMNERLQHLPKDNEITSTININKRIRLFYGEEYGLYYERAESGSLKAIVEVDGGKTNGEMESIGG